jgi:hypothetical protein
MNFSVGPLACSVRGEPWIMKHFERAFSCARAESRTSDIIFEFVGELPSWRDREYVSLDNFEITPDRIRVADRLFVYEVEMKRPLRVMVMPARGGLFRKIRHTIRKTWRYLHTHGRSSAIYYVKRFVYYVYMPMVQLALMREGASLAHCSAIEKDGKAILFPAWGGVGKTSIMSRYLDDGWRFISDDSCVIRNDGTAYTHPLPLHIYKYHEKQSGSLVARMLDNAGLWEWLLWRALSPLKKPDTLVRWVPPDRVFGREKLCERGAISGVIHLHRVKGLADFRVKTVEPDTIARVMASTIMDEVNGLADIAIVANSVQTISVIPDISRVYEIIVDVYSKAFSSASCQMVEMPTLSNAEDLYRFLAAQKLV